MFTSPASAEFIGPKDLLGHLLILHPIEHVEGVKTQYGLKDGIRVDIAVLTLRDPTTGQPPIYEGVTWLSAKLIASLKKSIGQLVLARMAQGAAKPGQEPAWELVDAMTDAQAVAAATAFVAAHPEFSSRTPIPQPSHTPAAAAAPANAAVPVQPIQYPLGLTAAAPAPVSIPMQPQAAQMASVPSGGIDPAVWASLPEDTRAQLLATGVRPGA